MKEAYLWVFCKENAESVAVAAGRSVKDGRILDVDGSEATCSVCSKRMTVDNLGRILPGSTKLCCDDPICFNHFSVDLL